MGNKRERKRWERRNSRSFNPMTDDEIIRREEFRRQRAALTSGAKPGDGITRQLNNLSQKTQKSDVYNPNWPKLKSGVFIYDGSGKFVEYNGPRNKIYS